MLKKVMSGALSVVMLSSCMGCSVKADPRLPQGHVNNLITMARNTTWWQFKTVNGIGKVVFNMEAFDKFRISYLARPENRDLGAQLINQLFEAEIEGNRLVTYNKLMNQYKENEQVQLALKEIREFLKSCDNITIQDKDLHLIADTEFKKELINMDPVLRMEIFRLETLCSLYSLITFPSNVSIERSSSLGKFFIPWRGEVDISSFSYGSLVSCLLLLNSRLNLPRCEPQEKIIDSIRKIESFASIIEVERCLPRISDGLSPIETFNRMGNSLNSITRYPSSEKNRPLLDGLMIRIIKNLKMWRTTGPIEIS